MKPTDTKNLSWKDAWWHLLNGKKIKRPLWEGYWAWEESPKDDRPSIMMHCRDGSVVDIRDTDFVAYTFCNIAQRDWMVVDEISCNDCYLSMQNCHDASICCEDEEKVCDNFEALRFYYSE